MKQLPCLAATSEVGSLVTADACSNLGAGWSWSPGEETVLIGEEANAAINIT